MSRLTVLLDDGTSHQLAASPDRFLSEILDHCGLPLNTRCGGRGLCHGCEVVIEQGGVFLRDGKACTAPATVRACSARATADLTISIPARSRMEHRPLVGETFRIDVPSAHLPLFPCSVGTRDAGFAIDIGTTTVVVLVIDLASGEILGRAGGFNAQIRFGDNVLTRIDRGRDPAALAAMQQAIVADTLVPLLITACDRAKRNPARLAGGTVAGNTTMLHLLLGVDPSPLGVAPFTARFLETRCVTTGQIGLHLPDNSLAADTPLHLLPGIAAYIGADITAGVHATGMRYAPRPALLVDIGTNGEIVLQSSGRLHACATAAGPAFEGSGLRSGTRAREGAVSAVRLSLQPFQLDLDIIGNTPPARAVGLCGSAYLDLLALGRTHGLLTRTGRFDPAVWNRLPAANRAEDEGEKILRLVPGNDHTLVGEVDIALLLQAKAAIGAGIESLLTIAGLAAEEVATLHLAGGFGMHLDVTHAITIGLLPGFQTNQIEVVGNTSLGGAVLALLDRTSLDEMDAIRREVDVLELNLLPDFEDRYIDHLAL